jgi:hypothetical protein
MQTDNKHNETVLRIATEHYRRTCKSEKEVQASLQKLVRVIQDDGAKLIHLGNVLFLIMVRGKGVVEVHILGKENNTDAMAKNFVQLAKVLKHVGVEVAYAYTLAKDDPFKAFAKKMKGFKIHEYEAKHEGKKLNVFVVEL